MKHLFNFKAVNKAFIISFCLLSALPNAQAASKYEGDGDILLAQAVGSGTNSTAKSTSPTKYDDEYILEFNRSPVVGNRMRLRGVYSEGRLGFTRPRGWNVGAVKALVRFQHSPALYANRSNLTVLVNDTAVGSIPLNRKQSAVGQVLLNIPPKLLQEYNELKIVAQQNNSSGCSDPSDPTLWTEILPDSELIFKFERKAIPLNFSNYPYPFFDNLNLETNRITYLKPQKTSKSWLEGAARLQASLGRQADFRPIETNLVSSLADVSANERLVIIGTPSEQPALADLNLPRKIVSSQILDSNQNPISEDTGVLILTTTKNTKVPVLIATGNGAVGVAKATQFLAQPDLRKMSTGQVVLVNKVEDSPTPGDREWSRFLPEANNFQLSDIKTEFNGDAFKDFSVRGSAAPPIEIDFRALPDDRFVRGSSMNLVYSYGPQMNPRTSAVEVLLDGVFIGGARLDSDQGETRKNLKVDLPAKLVQPDSKIQVFFRMNPKEPFDKANCISPPDQQLTGTVHADTSFDLKRENSVQLPDLKLMQYGFPFAAPQDLSKTAIVLPQEPNATDVLTMLAFSERLGRLSSADSVKLDVYTSDTLPEEVRKSENLVGIGMRERFPFPEVFKSPGFNLNQSFLRGSARASVQAPQDKQGMIKQILSPWNGDRVVLALTAQTETGLERVGEVLSKDPWFFQLKKDTVLISSDKKNPVAYDPDGYQLAFFDNAPSTRRIENTNILSKMSRMLQENWLLVPAGMVGLSLILYGIFQLYLKRVSTADRK
ncbi:cellulose biosynthesis cyclic di-GMP-binding regulatory protein BcsB [Rivularia sp. UHCC 0363]|uniref:cellulose biosynthesis cyclic di-GMP-binding regulatory protein BcsB n=1 Tax=Rivularia sp. UHCC 0363 TaxID=3110244 RepID=UPI002B1F6554|nr:cellulose biosynthesis cyclic di-GMP-binding regulatory protein BcsB [Rivularia sp. UHCC 0363]MEA5596660.1 cellulose biosynthesis cyclic di-GMP-binding regulatory protein BcsB [Rivularia sp. UHCC 0363]